MDTLAKEHQRPKKELMKRQTKYFLLTSILTLVFAFIAIFYLPHDRHVESLSIFLFKLIPFFLAAFSIALLDVGWVIKFRLVMPILFLCFMVIFCIFVPSIFSDIFYNESKGVYYLLLMLVPFTILTISLSYKLGGGTSGNSLRISFGLLALMLSGIEDLSFLLLNLKPLGHFESIPEVWSWASHIKVRIGHFPSKYEAFVFICVHITLAIVIAFYHFNFLNRVKSIVGIEDSAKKQ